MIIYIVQSITVFKSHNAKNKNPIAINIAILFKSTCILFSGLAACGNLMFANISQERAEICLHYVYFAGFDSICCTHVLDEKRAAYCFHQSIPK